MSQPNRIDAVVIDANVLIGICTKETKEPTARAALANYITRKWKFYAPNAIIPEFLHIACKKIDEGKLTAAQYEKAVEDFNDYMAVVLTSPDGDAMLIKRASENMFCNALKKRSIGSVIVSLKFFFKHNFLLIIKILFRQINRIHSVRLQPQSCLKKI
jgi:predicted nucleic acid-binding protein